MIFDLNIKLPDDISDGDMDIHNNSIWGWNDMLREEIMTFRTYCLERQYRCFLDIGSNTGIFSIIYCTSVPNHECHAIEPVRYHIDRLEAVAMCNGWNLVTHRIGLSDVEEQRVFQTAHMANFQVNEATVDPNYKDECRIMTLDSFVNPDHAELYLDCIKIDTEGFENQIMRGGRKTIAKYAPDLFIETHGVESEIFGERADEIVNYLNPDVYDFFDYTNKPLEYDQLPEYILSKNVQGFVNQRFIARNKKR
jgi:FkbM family methyltransferase